MGYRDALPAVVMALGCGSSGVETETGMMEHATASGPETDRTGGASGSTSTLGGTTSASASSERSSSSSGLSTGDAPPSGDHERTPPGFPDRPYLMHVPPGLDTPAPLVVVLHGGGGSPESMRRMTCPGADLRSDRCMDGVAREHGFVVVYPSGTPTPGNPQSRTWNAGGDGDMWQCVSGYACAAGVDELAYVDAVLDDATSFVTIDSARVYAVGLSNGGAMSHRLGCERADRIAAIASVAGGNQFSTTAPCSPGRPVPVIAFHGTEDVCWAYEGGLVACAQDDGTQKIAIPTTMEDWAARNGCDAAPGVAMFPDVAPRDGTWTEVRTWHACDAKAQVILLLSHGAGHTWPGGFEYADFAGPVVRDFDANAVIWGFFAVHARP